MLLCTYYGFAFFWFLNRLLELQGACGSSHDIGSKPAHNQKHQSFTAYCSNVLSIFPNKVAAVH